MGTSPAQHSLFAAVSDNHGVLLRQFTMNSHVKDIQFCMDMAGEESFRRSHKPSMVSQRSISVGEDHMEQRSQTGLVREKDCGIASFAQQSLSAAASGDGNVLSRQGIVNSHVNGAQFFMSMSNVGRPLQSGLLLDLDRSAIPMGRRRPLDDGGRSILPLFRLTDYVNRATQGCSHGADADEASQQAHHLREADDFRLSASSISGREVRTLLTSRNKHDDVQPTEHVISEHFILIAFAQSRNNLTISVKEASNLKDFIRARITEYFVLG